MTTHRCIFFHILVLKWRYLGKCDNHPSWVMSLKNLNQHDLMVNFAILVKKACRASKVLDQKRLLCQVPYWSMTGHWLGVCRTLWVVHKLCHLKIGNVSYPPPPLCHIYNFMHLCFCKSFAKKLSPSQKTTNIGTGSYSSN